MRIFLDSSSLAKRYIEESGSSAVDEVCLEATELAVSIICIPEMVSALNRRVREKKLSSSQYVGIKERVLEDVRDAVIVNLTPEVIDTSLHVLENNQVRALDALHVACAIQWQADLFVSADRRQIAAAAKSGLRTRTV